MKALILDLTEVEPVAWMHHAKIRLIPIECGNHIKQFDLIESQIPADDLAIIKSDSAERLALRGLDAIDAPVGFDVSALPIGAKIIVMDNSP